MDTQNKYLLPSAIVIAGIIISFGIIYQSPNPVKVSVNSEETVLPVRWGVLGKQLVSSGVIDGPRFQKFYEGRGGLTLEKGKLLNGNNLGHLKITKENASFLLNLFWALGLANRNEILDSGEMTDPRYGGVEKFASTAGWTMARGNAIDHYSQHSLIVLTPEQQSLVNKISKGIYRPCCDNSTHFPDCNHGMAMLGLLELMASQGINEQDMWKTALVVNSYWFPEAYLAIASYMSDRGVTWENVNPKEILGRSFSSASGFAKIASQVRISNGPSNGGGCGIETTSPALQKTQGGCGI